VPRHVNNFRTCSQCNTGTYYCLFAYPDSFHNNCPRSNDCIVFNNHWRCLNWLQNPTYAHAATQVDIFSNLCTRSNSSPSIYHGTTVDISSYINIGGHHNYTACKKRAISRNSMRNHPNTLFGIVGFEGHLVVEFKGSNFNGLHLLDGEIKDDGFLHPVVNFPIAIFRWFSDSEHTTVQIRNNCFNCDLHFFFLQQCPVFPGFLYDCYQFHCFHLIFLVSIRVNETSSVSASVPKPVPAPRAFSKRALSLRETNKYRSNLIGFCSKKSQTVDDIGFTASFCRKRTHISRLFASLKFLRVLFQDKIGRAHV